MSPEAVAAKLKGIQDAWDGTPEGVKSVALSFVKMYATDHQFFTGGDILAAFRQVGLPGSELDWRNKWGAVISAGAKAGWYIKAGKVSPTTKQSHTDKLTQWQSRLYKGEQALSGATAQSQLEDIRKRFVLREFDLRKALWLAYEVGLSQSEGEKK